MAGSVSRFHTFRSLQATMRNYVICCAGFEHDAWPEAPAEALTVKLIAGRYQILAFYVIYNTLCEPFF